MEEKYDYYWMVTEDVCRFLDTYDYSEYPDKRSLMDDLSEILNDNPNVTGCIYFDSTSPGRYNIIPYTQDNHPLSEDEAYDNLRGNLGLLCEALVESDEYSGDQKKVYMSQGARYADAIIRHYVLPAAVYDAVEEIADRSGSLERFEREYETDRYSWKDKQNINGYCFFAEQDHVSHPEWTDDDVYDDFLFYLEDNGIALYPKEAVSEADDDEAEL